MTCQHRIGPISLCSLSVVPGTDRCERHSETRLPDDLLDEIEDFLDDHSDAEYVDGVPKGNKAMRLLGELRRVRGE